ncbi:MurR/RpiR family transcriptional regulator [Vagococcus elongatus]|nr:MurR/RpiR family transcriptional regulator [Vagococcus elongatus]
MSFFDNFNKAELTDVERTVYQYIVENAELIPYQRVREIAGNAHVSTSSVLRFLKKMGFDSFSEFKFDFKQKLNKQAVEDSFSDQHFDILNRRNFSQDLEHQIKKVSKQIYAADSVIFFGMGASGTMADYVARRLANVGINALSITDPTYPIKSHMAGEGTKKVLIVLSTSGNTREIIETMLLLQNTPDLFKVAITGNLSGKLVGLCDYVIDYHLKQDRMQIYYDLTSQIPAIFILELLVQKTRELQKRNTV